MPRSTTDVATSALPYFPGWFDRLTDWVDRMPGPNFVYALGLLVFQFAYMTALLWLDGKLPVGSVDFRLVFLVVVTPYLLGAVLPGWRRRRGTRELPPGAHRR